MRKTKIVCTLGPATDSPKVLEELMLAGMNVARINFSHGNYEDQADRINTFKEVREKLNLPIPLLLDTQGPEIRIGKFNELMVELRKGNTFTLLNNDEIGDETKVSITYKELYKDVAIGGTILINDGTIELKVVDIENKDIICEIIQGGKLTNRKSINVPDLKLNLPGVTKKDINDIKYGIQAGFDYIAASFIRKPQDVLEIKEILKQNNGEHIKIISKIENREGIDNFDEILNVSDGIMVARGDLGVEIPIEEIPIRQKEFIKKTYKQGKPVITATQMLESMITNSRPTRAEVSDIANAIYDGSSAIMLSGETATGEYPVECVKVMSKVAISTENSINYWKGLDARNSDIDKYNYKFIMNYAICSSAANLNAKAIVAYTNTGDTARALSSFGAECPIFAITKNLVTYRQLGLAWNITPKMFLKNTTKDELLSEEINLLKKENFLKQDDIILIAGGESAVNSMDNSQIQINKAIGGIVKI